MSDSSIMVLAAGGSTRMGQPKQLLRINGTSLLRHAAETALEANVGPVLIVLGHDADEMSLEINQLPVVTAINPNWSRGIGSSIRCGIVKLMELTPPVKRVIIVLCDQPLIRPSHLRHLAEAHEQTGKPICVSAFAGGTGPPVLIARSLFQQLLFLNDAHGAKQIWSNRPEDICQISCEEAGTDIDTATDYERFISGTTPPFLPA